LGAHHDHFGSQGGLVFPGADDNASGTAVLLEVARALSITGVRPKRSILFISFAGEEQGLLGSRYFVAHPSVPLAAMKAMLNVDHAGVGNGKLTVGLSGLEKTVAQTAAERVGLGGRVELFGLFPGGDHVPFADAGVPTATVVTSGPHPDFHRPSDWPEKIDPQLLATATHYTLSLLWFLANDTL
jgi:Zn-dependent M28 family amino/carboxypeptidase